MPQAPASTGLSMAGLIFMTLSVAFVTGLVAWCYWKIFTAPAPKEPPEPVKDFHSA